MRMLSPLPRAEIYAVALIALSLVAFASVTLIGDSAKLGAALERISPGLLLMLAGLACVNYVLRSARFQMFARSLGVRIAFAWMLIYYVAGFAMSATPGKLGELVRLWLIRQRHGYSIELLLPLQIADRTIDVVASVILCIVALGAFVEHWTVVVGAGAVVAIGVVLLMQPALLYAAIDALYRGIGRKGRWFARLRRQVRMVARLFRPKLFLPSLALAIVGWGAECVALDLCMRAIAGIDGLGRATFIFTFSNLLGGLTLLPGGVGGTEISMAGLLVASGGALESATAVTAVIRLTTLWFGMALGTAAFALLARRFKSPA